MSVHLMLPPVPVPKLIHPWTRGWNPLLTTWPTALVSAAFNAADTAYYTPLWVPTLCVARRLFWANGSTVSGAYNVDVGIYADSGGKPGNRLVSTGLTAQGTALQLQFVDTTDTVVTPGLWWLAITCSSTSATFYRYDVEAYTAFDTVVGLEQASASPLPATATPVEGAQTQPAIYTVGFATTASP